MSVRVGIELAPSACRIVKVEARSRGDALDTRVRACSVLPPDGAAREAALSRIRRTPACVIVWGVPTDHRQVMVTAGPYERMHAEALAALAKAGVQTRGALAGIAPVGRTVRDGTRGPVVAAVAAADAVTQAIAPLNMAGVRVRAVVTPAAALASIARMRRFHAGPGAIEAYVALEEAGTCIALTRDGALLAARELASGFTGSARGGGIQRRTEDVANGLADTLAEFFAAVGTSAAAVSQVCVCGGLSDLRSMAVRLTERLDVEVEPLDSLFGIDAAQLPGNAAEFRERIADLRLAWAAAADWPAPLNLLRVRHRAVRRAGAARAAAVAAVIIAGVGLGWRFTHGSGAQSTTAIHAARTTSAVRSDTSFSPLPRDAVMPPPGPPHQGSAPDGLVRVARGSAAAAGTLESLQAVGASNSAAPRRPLPMPTPTRAVPDLAPSTATPVPPGRVPSGMSRSDGTDARPSGVRPPPETALPYDAALETILYSSDRKLAIVDGRIVAVGDQIRAARVIEITPDAVFLRDAEGRLRRLALRGR